MRRVARPRRDDGSRRDDGGAVAIIAALTVTFLLIPVAALAADLGAVYVREGDLQQVADVAARAGADQLALLQRDDASPATVVPSARAAAVQAMCAGIRPASEDPWAEQCSDPSWASDGDPSDGEVSFYAGAPNADGRFSATQAVPVTGATGWVTGIRVVTPPLRVEFGLAAAFTTDHTDLQRASTAGIFTVLPRNGFFPMYLSGGEYGGFCTRSAPKAVWQPTHPYCPYSGAGDVTVARGYLVAPRTKSAENTASTTWNTAVGFDREHLPLTGLTATLGQNYWYSSYNYVSALVRDLDNGLFVGTPGGDHPGRLSGIGCRGGNSAMSGPHSGVQGAYLTDFLDLRLGDKYAFRDTVKSPGAPSASRRGWLDPAILQCGRLAVVPVLTGIANPPNYYGTSPLTYGVGGLRLIWLDDRLWATDTAPVATGGAPGTTPGPTESCLQRGFYWADPNYSTICRTDLRAYTGYVVDPRLLPAIVTDKDATNVLDRFVGSGMPATVRLLRDVSDPPA